jgi:hypothetical protein
MNSRQKDVPGEGSTRTPLREAFKVLNDASATDPYGELYLLEAIITLLNTPEFIHHIHTDYASVEFGRWIGSILSGRGGQNVNNCKDELLETACPEWYAEELEARELAEHNQAILREEANQRRAREEQRAELRREMEELQAKMDSLAEQVKRWQ